MHAYIRGAIIIRKEMHPVRHLSLVLCSLLVATVSVGQHTCTAIGGSTGMVQTTTGDTLSFNVTYSPTSYLLPWVGSSSCGFDFPATATPWSGNWGGATSIVTYSFSEPIYSLDIILAYVGLDSFVVQETFLFGLNQGATASVLVNSGTCPAWTVDGWTTTSPAFAPGMNAVHTIFSSMPFTDVSIITNSSMENGGSSYALCDGSLSTTSIATSINSASSDPGIKLFPNPMIDRLHLGIPDGMAIKRMRLIDLFGREIFTASISGSGEIQLPPDVVMPGTYVVELLNDVRSVARRSVIVGQR